MAQDKSPRPRLVVRVNWLRLVSYLIGLLIVACVLTAGVTVVLGHFPSYPQYLGAVLIVLGARLFTDLFRERD